MQVIGRDGKQSKDICKSVRCERRRISCKTFRRSNITMWKKWKLRRPRTTLRHCSAGRRQHARCSAAADSRSPHDRPLLRPHFAAARRSGALHARRRKIYFAHQNDARGYRRHCRVWGIPLKVVANFTNDKDLLQKSVRGARSPAMKRRSLRWLTPQLRQTAKRPSAKILERRSRPMTPSSTCSIPIGNWPPSRPYAKFSKACPERNRSFNLPAASRRPKRRRIARN